VTNAACKTVEFSNITTAILHHTIYFMCQH